MSKKDVLEEDKDYTPPSRKQMLRFLDVGIQEALYKIENGRIRKPENEKVRIQWIKALGYLANSYRQLIKDKELEELAERVEKLEEVSLDV
ncbi:hypothetical protein AKJ51_02970 [candidate division MSBL1 archaeon SCGC-AAA382A20]|uniref:DUF8136 domain-containing protein n=1 Tax=candidate division MSBL1 archaeon SCGC-AAA382A20 TaxID=1698280 RepID=A0A133VK11_9EURY|nr:hypothetical protein AKJ51_02970 [candidate division MSBL1 archaeon SCGC-AAA382A20]